MPAYVIVCRVVSRLLTAGGGLPSSSIVDAAFHVIASENDENVRRIRSLYFALIIHE